MDFMMTAENGCVFCGKRSKVIVAIADFEAWQNGGLAQKCFPYLSTEEREMFISGICPSCQEKVFGKVG